MRISETITISGGNAYAIISNSEGSMLLRPTAMPRLMIDFTKSRAEVVAPVEVPQAVIHEPEPVTVARARVEMVSISTRYGSCEQSGSRKSARLEFGSLYMYKRTRRPSERPDSWKKHRSKQYRSRDKRHEGDPNPVHLDI